ncbi:MAG: TonB-dependent receptor [Pseudomonadales bacterium]
MSARICLVAGVLAMALAPGLPAAAQAAGAQGAIEEVVVTARRRAESLQETPVSVSVLDQDLLRDLRLDDITQMMRLVPNATVPNDSEGLNTYIVIRGIRQPDPQIEPNFGLYRNGIFYGGSRTNLRTQVDVERLEVSRGSQGGVYGRNSSGGAVNIVYGTPKDEFDGYAGVTYGKYDRKELEGMVNIPVSDTLAVRAAAWWFDTEGGQFKNVLRGEDLDFVEDEGLRLSARWDLAERVSLLLTGEYAKASGPSFLTYSPGGLFDFLSLLGLPGASRPAESPDSIRRDTREYLDLEQYYLSANLEWQTDLGTLNLLTSYRNYEMDGVRDGDSGDFDPSEGFFVSSSVRRPSEDVDNTYVELLWTSPQEKRLIWVAGVSYYEENFDFERLIESVIDFDVTPLAPGVSGLQTTRTYLPVNSPLETESVSAFLSVDYDLTDRLTGFASLRYIEDEKRIDFRQFTDCDLPAVCLAIYGDPSVGNFGAFGFFGLLFPDFATQISDTFSNWLPGAGLRFAVNDRINVYASVQTGTRAGGFNTTTTQPANIPYDPEESVTWELGAKSTWMEGRLNVNASVFLFEQDDFLLFAEDPVNPFFSALQNVGKAETVGVELEINGQITPWLFGGLAYGYMDPEIKKGINFGTDISGSMINRVREHTASLFLSWDVPLTGTALRLIGNVNSSWEIGGYESPNEANPIEDLEVVDVALGVAGERWRVTGFVDNVGNDTVTLFTFGFPSVQDLTRDRRWGIEFTYDF